MGGAPEEKELVIRELGEGHPRRRIQHGQRPWGGKKLGMIREHGG